MSRNAVRTRGAVSCSSNREGNSCGKSGMSGGSATGRTSGSVHAVNREAKRLLPEISGMGSATCEASGKLGSLAFEDPGSGMSEALGSGGSSIDREDEEARS